ncbi:LOW QUALITY PROTEIN: hypothetical protein PHMEG_00022597 [Phytophthora megakarya]|uniref:Aspartic protease n=1 Tax=Phytophthora megakarya TaxID=4795 RepID=A0A225VLC5_9STRA|nr:LOW QUALITY PROTEIN: hypothetical protein PHMEG_00022597 [Phytophthora megakarya]
MNSHSNSNPGAPRLVGSELLGRQLLFTGFRPWFHIPPSYLAHARLRSPHQYYQPRPCALKLRVEPRGELLLNGIDGVKTKVTNMCRVKITLGHRVVYTLDVWVGNFGQGIDVLLGMNFMVAAGVRLCAHEGKVVLPDEERILLVGGPNSHLGRTIDVFIHESLWLAPGDSKYIPIRTSEPDFGSMDVWVSWEDSWVTLVFLTRISVAVQVVNISRRPVQVLPHTKVATLTDRDRLPLGTNFVHPGSYQYDEREFLVYENTRSSVAERRLDAEVRELERTAPPMVDRPTYPTPTRVLRRTLGTRAVGPGPPVWKRFQARRPPPDYTRSSARPEAPESAPMDAQVTLARSFVMVAMAGESLDADLAVYYH